MSRVLTKLKGAVKSAFQHYSTIIISAIPCIIVGSLVDAILNILTRMPLVHGGPISEAYPWVGQLASVLSIVSSCGVMMIPVYITWATVRHFKGPELLGIFVGLCLVPVGLMSGLDWPQAVLSGTASYFELGSWQIPKTGFQGQMLVGILSGMTLVGIERRLKKAVPEAIQIFVVPLAGVVGTVFATYLVIGPAARILERGMVAAAEFFLVRPELKNIGGLVMGLAHLPMMMFGIHLALVSVNLQMVSSPGGSPLWAITVASALSAGGAALAELIFGDKEMKESAREGTVITLGLGTVEPALFGVCAKDRCAFLGAVLAAGLSGFLSRALDCGATLFGINGFFSFLSFPLDQWPRYALVLATAVIGSFSFTTAGLFLRRRKKRRNNC